MSRVAKMALAVLLVWMVFTAPVWAATGGEGAQLFDLHCAGCHLNGGNIVRRGKTLKLPALQRNGYDTVEAITAIVSNGKGNMSAYKERLTPDQIAIVADYVLQQATQNWH